MSSGCISNHNSCPSEIKLKSPHAVTQSGVHFGSFKLWAVVPQLLAPTSTTFPLPSTQARCSRSHTRAPRTLRASTNNHAATQSARRVCWSTQKGILLLFLFCQPAFQLPAGSVAPPGPPCQRWGLLCPASTSPRAGCLPPAGQPRPDTPSKMGPGNTVTQLTCFRAGEANVTGRAWLIKVALTDRTACVCFL